MSRCSRALIAFGVALAFLVTVPLSAQAAVAYELFAHGNKSGTVGAYFSADSLGSTLISGAPLVKGEGLAYHNGILYVASESNKVLRYNAATGGFIDTYISTLPNNAVGLTFGADGNLYIGDGLGGVRKYNVSTNTLSTYLAAGTVSTTPGGGTFQYACRIAFGPDGKLYIPDQISNKVYAFDGTTLTTAYTPGVNGTFDIDWGPDGNAYVLSENFSGTGRVEKFTSIGGSPSTFLSLADPYGMVFAPDNRLFVGQWSGNVVRAYDATTGALLSTVMNNANGGDGTQFGPAQLDIALPEPVSGLAVLGVVALAVPCRRRRSTI